MYQVPPVGGYFYNGGGQGGPASNYQYPPTSYQSGYLPIPPSHLHQPGYRVLPPEFFGYETRDSRDGNRTRDSRDDHRTSDSREAHRRDRRSKSADGRRKKDKHSRNQPDHERETLTEWGAWRTIINGGLSKDIVQNTYREIPVGDDFRNLSRSQHRGGRDVYHYSTAIDQGTLLPKDDYINFGIPRANVSTNGAGYMRSSNADGVSGQSSDESESERDNKPFYVINKIREGEMSREHNPRNAQAPNGYLVTSDSSDDEARMRHSRYTNSREHNSRDRRQHR